MEKPIKRREQDLPSNFVDYLYQLYECRKNAAGIYFPQPLDYCTNETTDYMCSEIEKEFIEEYGLAPIGFWKF